MDRFPFDKRELEFSDIFEKAGDLNETNTILHQFTDLRTMYSIPGCLFSSVCMIAVQTTIARQDARDCTAVPIKQPI